ncbi:GntR family transcriptional regulator [Paenibacillus nasutitermitis]|uniref:Transcriptional regulator n=1 Tax=Paenibacillus nasutitermitis TaxID=1652958 RepID=A0A917DXP4_9BACL|nr:GntR family transcriptional regulator [Paenibacillus nasutitermitis]GGD77516.1 transcriptional regulator [Paenibacillus nasutitermitis]
MKKTKIPLYAKIREYIKNQIDSGELKPGDQVPTEAELMGQFGVSRVTIITAVRYLVEDGLLYRVAGKGTFVQSDPPSLPAANRISLPVKKSVIGFIMHPARDLFMYRLLLGIEQSCREAGYGLMVRSSFSQDDELQAIKDLLDWGVEGLIIHPFYGEAYNEAILKLRADQFPFVLVDRYLPGIPTNAVFSDNYEGGKMAAEYLIRLGHTQIGVVSSPISKASSSEDRFQGYLDAFRAKSLQVQPHQWLTRIDEDLLFHDEVTTREAIEEWLTEHNEMTAIFTTNSIDAIYVATVAEKLGIAVPGNLSILSFDDPGISDLQKHYFTHMRQDIESMGEKSVELLIRAIDDPSTLERIKIPVSLVEGRSTLSLPAENALPGISTI